MKPVIIATICLLAITSPCLSQTDEFTIHENGLIYSPADMKILGNVVDSLNLRFKSCELNADYYSHPQGKLWRLEFSSKTNNLQQIKKDIEDGKDYAYIVKTYKDLIHEDDTSKLLIKVIGANKTYFLAGTAAEGYENIYKLQEDAFQNNTKWAFHYQSKRNYSHEYRLDCYYLPNPFTTQPIPASFARLIQYVDCMIDTNTTVMLGEAAFRNYDQPAFIKPVNGYLNEKMKLQKNKKDPDYNYVTNKKLEYVKNNLLQDQAFVALVKKATEECIEQKTGSWELEQLAGVVISQNKRLELMRYRRVIGRCSQDPSPRMHAKNIALLAAETHCWDIFLRAHLDIMNDRFERMSDGSYAYGARKTYLKELEELGLNVTDLVLGLTLRSQNVAPNHYYGTVWRLGRAVAESRDRLAFEKRIVPMLNNEKLDDFNRGLLALLYRSYLDYLPDEQEKTLKVNAFTSSFPDLVSKTP